MGKKALLWRCWCWKLAGVSYLAMGGAIPFGIATLHAFLGDCALAQITPDATLPVNSVVTPQGNTSVITGGSTAGNNLFHSFDEFSVPTGGTAYFNNALNIQNIISRVTGKSISNIDGLLRANGTANLFVFNPNGIIFGPNATLAIGGSFVGSTASSLNFADSTQFSATNPQAPPLLRVSVPIGLQYGGTAGSILNQSRATNSSGENVGLQVQLGETLALLGGDVSLDGGILFAPGGRVELGGVTGSGTVGLQVDSNNPRLSYPAKVQRADVSLSNGARVVVTAGGGGTIAVNAQNLNLTERSILLAGIASGLGSFDSQAGNIELSVQEAITVANNSLIYNLVLPGAVGNGGDININTGSLSVTARAQLSASTFGQGNAGNAIVNARDNVSLDNSPIFSIVDKNAMGRGGKINITTRFLSLTNGAQLDVSTFGSGSSGNIIISAHDSVSLDGASPDGERASTFFTEVVAGAQGDGGNIEISTGSLSVTNGAVLEASTRGRGNAGNIFITAHDTVLFDGVRARGPSGAFSDVEQGAIGRGGSIQIVTGSLSVTNSAQLGANTEGQGDAGNVIITARDSVSFAGESRATTGVVPEAEGAGGNIVVTTGSLDVRNGSQIVVGTAGRGDAGNVIINARDTVSFDGVGSNGLSSAAASSVEFGAVGNGGGINVTTGSLSVTNGAFLSARSAGNGAAGNLEVMADSIRLNNQADLIANTTAGQGNIFLRSQDLVLRRGSNITTNATGTATGGNITIDTGILAALEDSDISANASEARGGQVRIDASGIFGIEFRERENPATSDITATSEVGSQFSGTVEINTPDVDTNLGLVALPAELVDAPELVATACAAVGENEFIITGRGGLPPSPSDPLSAEAVLADWATLRERAGGTHRAEGAEGAGGAERDFEASPAPPAPPASPASPPRIVEAQGWVINKKGELVLTATAPNATPHNPWMTPANCHTSQNSS